jgi:hypothetical protein
VAAAPAPDAHIAANSGEELKVTLWGAIAHVLASLHQIEIRLDALENALGSEWITQGNKQVRKFPEFAAKEKAPAVKREPITTDYCIVCGESPESGTHLFKHEYVAPGS